MGRGSGHIIVLLDVPLGLSELFFFVTLSLLNLAESFFFFFGKSGIASNEGRRSTMTIL